MKVTMRSLSLVFRTALALMLSLSISASHAAASGSVVFDPTNFTKNTETSIATAKQVLESIKQTAQQVAMVKQQVTMANKMIADVRGLNVSALRGLVDPQTFDLLMKLAGAHSSYSDVNRDLYQLNSRLEMKKRAAEMSRMPLDKFVRGQIEAALKGSKEAQFSLQRDVDVMKSTQKSVEAASKWRDEIGGLNDNLGGSMQLLNTQLSAVVAGNAEMLGYMARVNAESSKQRAAQSETRVEKMEEHAKSMKELAAEERERSKNAANINGEVFNPWKR